MLLGFDIGGTKCAVILGRNDHDSISIIAKKVLPTQEKVGEMIELIFEAGVALLKEQQVSIDEIEGIGISCGGPLNSKKGIILSPPNLPGWDAIPIVQMTEERFGRPAFLQNDANACAVAEWKYGAGKGYDNLIFLTFGTGMGAGLILDGRLYSGTSDLAGEVGHMRLAEMGPVGFGKSGSFEGFCSGGGLAQLAQAKVREKLQMGEKVSFCKDLDALPALTAKMVAEAAYAGDPLAKEIYTSCGFWLGRGLSVLIDLLNPQVIIIGSIYGRTNELLDTVMHKVIAEEALQQTAADCKIIPAGLKENIGDVAALSLAVMAATKKVLV